MENCTTELGITRWQEQVAQQHTLQQPADLELLEGVGFAILLARGGGSLDLLNGQGIHRVPGGAFGCPAVQTKDQQLGAWVVSQVGLGWQSKQPGRSLQAALQPKQSHILRGSKLGLRLTRISHPIFRSAGR